jgi:hypothetical protein
MRAAYNFRRNVSIIQTIAKETRPQRHSLPLRNYSSSSMRSSNLVENKWSIQTYFERLFSIPKGFKKFYPKGKTESPPSGGSTGSVPKEKQIPKGEQNAEKASENTFKSKKKTSGSGGGKKDEDPFMSNIVPITLGVAAIGASLYLLDSSGTG